jgi:selenocysteine lyase/cysteine desulfurase
MECQRHLFSLPEDQHYLNCAYMSPLLRSVEAAGIAGLRRKTNPAGLVPGDFFDETQELRYHFARLVHTRAERVALVPAVSYGMAIASHNTRLRRGQSVVLPAEEFPSNVYAWMSQCQHSGARLRFVERPDPASTASWTVRLLEAIDHNTAVVTLSTVHWTDGTRFDVEQIGRRTREVGALFVVDGTQSIGAVPFDFVGVQPDLLVCAGYKWLFGPYQYSFAVVGDRLLDAEPFEHNWITRKNSQDFGALINYQSEFQPGAQRFDAGERSNFILVPMLVAALQQLDRWGVANIQAYCARLSSGLADALTDSPYTLAAERSAHLFGVRLPDAGQIPAILAELRRRQVYVSQRGSSIRVSPHVYNRPEDMHALADALLMAVG